MTREEAGRLVEDPLYLGTLMIKAGDADGEVAGARNATGDVLRPAFQIVRTMPGISIVSGAFIMIHPDPSFGEEGVIVFADGAVHPDPDERQLAEIAVATASTTRSILGFEPRIAMISFSTKGSATHPMVDKVVNATRIAREMDPSLVIDGELQADAALVKSIAGSKAPESLIQGDANVLIFSRIREEVRNGNSPQASIHAGYDKALSTIVDANVTTLIAAVVLFSFGTGPIKGFAVVLFIGILTSMFTAIMGTRAVINLIYGGRRSARLLV